MRTPYAAVLSSVWIAATFCPAQSLTMLVYDYAELTTEETSRATRVTEVALGHAGIVVHWVYCRGLMTTGQNPACATGLAANQIVVRLARPERNPSTSSNTELGQAFVGADGGWYMTVFVPSVREQAAKWRVAFDLVLGYAIAHEAGHCLLGPKHSSVGLMRSPWTREDVREIVQLRLGFLKQEANRAIVRLKPAGASAAPTRAPGEGPPPASE